MDTSDRDKARGQPASVDEAGLKRIFSKRFEDDVDAELANNRIAFEDARVVSGAGLRRPATLFAASIALAAVFLSASAVSYRARTEAMFLGPSQLFGTETMLIEALKKRTDLEIGKRDKLIEQYRARAEKRETIAMAIRETGSVQATAPKAAAVAATSSAAAYAEVDGLVAEKLSATLAAVAADLRRSNTAAAAARLEDLRAALLASPGAGTPGSRSAIAVSEALGSSLRRVESLAGALELSDEDNLSLSARVLSLEREIVGLRRELAGAVPSGTADDPAPAALQRENAALRAALASRSAEAVAEGAVAAPDGAFLGTVSIVAGDRIIIDLSPSEKPEPGSSLSIYRPGGRGKGLLVAIATIVRVRDASAEASVLSLLDAAVPPRVQDAAYLDP